MKPSFIAFFFLFAFIASSAKAEVVHDASGEPLRNGGSYHILPYIWALGGGIALVKTGDETCPLTVTTTPEIDNGLPWRIATLVRPTFVLANYTVSFSTVEGKVPDCVNANSEWTIVEGEDGTMSVKITGYESTVKGVFKILPFTGYAYKIRFCLNNGDSCKDVGRSRNGLVLTDDAPLGVVFFNPESSNGFKQRIYNVLEA